ncbi:MAG: alanine racemase C-terminal domain-containing protein [Microbacteriaceae bacterium]
MAYSLRVAKIATEVLSANIERALLHASTIDISGNAYGHGATEVAKVSLEYGASLWVATSDDADWLRGQGIHAPILVADQHEPVARNIVYGFEGGARPVMTLVGRVILTKAISAGDGVSYGYTFRAPSNGRTALVSLGYGDGIHRRAGNLSLAQVAGRNYPIVGRVAMNVFVLFLGTESVDVGAEVVVFGDPEVGHPTLLDWSARLGEVPLAVTSGLTDRVSRVFL